MLLDALGTLLRLEPPAPRLAEALGIPVQSAGHAIRAEIAFYRANLHRGADAAGLAGLRRDCARVVAEALPDLDRPLDELEAALLDAIVFTPYGDTVPALRRLRAAGIRLVALSNWDVSLHEVLARTGLDAHLDGAVSSAETGAAKPDRAPFERALSLAGAEPAGAWHAGDSVLADVHGARAAGVRPVLVARPGEELDAPVPEATAVVPDLGALADLALASA